jgi:hypothetical protein
MTTLRNYHLNYVITSSDSHDWDPATREVDIVVVKWRRVIST